LPARDLATLSVHDLWLRSRGDMPPPARTIPHAENLATLIRGFEDGIAEGRKETVREWLSRMTSPAP
jgi:hypothetical protein